MHLNSIIHIITISVYFLLLITISISYPKWYLGRYTGHYIDENSTCINYTCHKLFLIVSGNVLECWYDRSLYTTKYIERTIPRGLMLLLYSPANKNYISNFIVSLFISSLFAFIPYIIILIIYYKFRMRLR